MLCPSCGHDNIEGADRCEECMTSLFNLDVPQAGRVSPETSAIEVIAKMKAAGLGCALVMDEGKLVGIFTERDLLNKLTGKSASSPNTAVKDLMSANPETLDETDSVATALNRMSMGRYRHIPVRKADGTYSVTSIKHVLKYIAKAEW